VSDRHPWAAGALVVLVSDGETVTVETQQAAPTDPLSLREGTPIAPGATEPVVPRTTTNTTDDVTDGTPTATDGGTGTASDGGTRNESDGGQWVADEIRADAESDDLLDDAAVHRPGVRCLPDLAEGLARRGRHAGVGADERELPPERDANVVGQHRLDAVASRERVVERVDAVRPRAVEFAVDEPGRPTCVRDDARRVDGREDVGDAAGDVRLADRLGDPPLVVDPVLERDDGRLRPDERVEVCSGLAGVLGLHREQDVVDRPDFARVVRRGEVDGGVAGDALDAQPS